MRRAAAVAAATILIALASGCSTDRGPIADSGGGGNGDSAVKADGAPATDGQPVADGQPAAPPCPTSLPQNGAGCTREGLVCQYGDDPRRSCRPRAACQSGAWALTTPKCTNLPAVTCPATRADAAGNKCTPMDAYCSYPGDLTCHCTNCVPGPAVQCVGDPKWLCDAPNADSECPAGKPNLGLACSQQDKKCVYGCGSDGARLCKDGAWIVAAGSPCPVSSRRLKKNITYLTPAQRQALARRALAIKLATYRYKDPSYGAGPQLGFILEDVGKSFAGDPARGRVNLYGYASMLLATVQAQQRALDALRAEVRALKKRVGARSATGSRVAGRTAPRR